MSAPIPYDGLLSVIVLAAIMIAIGAAPIRGLVAADRQVLFWISGAATAAVTLCVSAVGAPATVLLDARFAELVSSAALVSTIALWLWSPFTRRLTSTRIVAAAATGPAFAALLSAVLFAAPEVVRIAIPGASAVLVTLVALLVNTRRALAAAPDPSLRQRLPRWAADAGALAAAAITVLAAIASATQEGWLAALLLAAALFIASICSGRPFGFGSPRGLLVWPAVIIATAALWSRLAEGGTTELELYLLPPTLVLLLLAWWIERSRRRDDAASALLSRAAAAVILVALLLTLLPIAVISAGGSEPLRLPLVAAVSVILLLAGSALRHPIGQRLLDAVALAGALATITAVGGRALVLADREPERIAVDGWLALLVAALITAAVLLVRRNDDTRAQGHWSIAAMIAAITAIVVIESLATAAPGLALIRAVMAVLLLAALHVLALMVDRAPFSPAVGWTAIGGAAMLALVIVSTDRVDPLESVTVPIALALLATGAMRMLQHPQARSWPWLGPGLAVALLPSLLATTWEPALWRLVALGAASVAAAVIGATLRLQAPFLLGIAGALVHGVATFMPQLRTVYEAVEWWLWLGIGGAILIALAVRYERRIRDAREAVRRIRTMR